MSRNERADLSRKIYKEQECLECFPVIKDAIILEQDYLKRKMDEAEKNIESSISSIASKLK